MDPRFLEDHSRTQLRPEVIIIHLFQAQSAMNDNDTTRKIHEQAEKDPVSASINAHMFEIMYKGNLVCFKHFL